MHVLAFVAFVLAGCLGDPTIPCGSLRCPSQQRCHSATLTCVTQEQIDGCTDATDGTHCTYVGIEGTCATGACMPPRCGDARLASSGEQCDEGTANTNAPDATCRLDCTLPRCGDGVTDSVAGEVCDDGNLIAGDGCRPDCRSREECGDGTLDPGEGCDDGNELSRDGCSGCQHESALSFTTADAPLGRTDAAFAYDAARQRLVVFGGRFLGIRLDDTWELEGSQWRRLEPLHRPPPITNAAMVYDAARSRIVLFGGQSVTGPRGETWQWDGADWRHEQLSVSPIARTSPAMSYDMARKRVVLFGGTAAGGTGLADTWEWDGSTWALRSPPTSPPAGAYRLAYDVQRRRSVLVGGAATWLWDGTDWTPVASTLGGAAAAAAFDPVLQQVVAIRNDDGTTWTWNGLVWSSTAIVPLDRSLASIVWDGRRRRIVAFGGINSEFQETADVNVLEGTTWVPIQPTEPPLRFHTSLVFDPVRGRMVLFGGKQDASTTLDDTWEWAGDGWSALSIGSPPPTSHAASTFDVSRRAILVWGGMQVHRTPMASAWEYDGTWRSVSEVSAPPPRRNTRIAYDTQRNTLVLFGGDLTSSSVFSRTGLTWTETLPLTGPTARHGHAMVFDPVRGETILYGGSAPAEPFPPGNVPMSPQAWSWNGTAWSRLINGPWPRRGHSLVFDDRRQRTVLVGTSPISNYLELWELVGVEWTPRAIVSKLGRRDNFAAAYDSIRQEIVVVGGRAAGFVPTIGVAPDLHGTLVLAWQPNAPAEACTAATIDYDRNGLAGCMDPECQPLCDPLCPPGVASCASTRPRCGDGVCGAIETCRLCPEDCGACGGAVCGDTWCDLPEDNLGCPADCP